MFDMWDKRGGGGGREGEGECGLLSQSRRSRIL